MAKTLQILRNQSLYDGHAAALAAIKGKLASAADGEPILARYHVGEGDDYKEYTILGIAGKTLGQYTIFDTEADALAVANALAEAKTYTDTAKSDLLGTLSNTHGATRHYATLAALEEALEAEVARAQAAEVSATTVVSGETATTGPAVKVTVDDSANDGHKEYKVAGQDLASAALLGTAADNKDQATAFGKIALEAERAEAAESALDERLDTIEGEGEGSIKKALADAKAYTEEKVEALDYTVAADANKFLTGFEVVDGELKANSITSATFASADNTVKVNGLDLAVNVDGETIVIDTTVGKKGQLKVASAALTQYVGSDAIAISNVDEDNNKTVSLVISDNDKVLSISSEEGHEGLIANISVSKKTTELGSDNIKEAYQIIGKNNAVLGTIPVYKDSSVKDVHIGVETDGEDTQKLYLTYIKADGSEEEVAVDFGAFVAEAEAGNGLYVESNVLHVGKADDSESFLVINENDIAIKGVQTAINTAAAASKTVVKDAVEGQSFVNVTAEVKDGEGEDGHTEYKISVSDIASATLLAKVDGADTVEGSFRKAVKDAKEAIEGTLVEGDAKTLQAINAELNGLDAAVAAAKTVVSGESGNGAKVLVSVKSPAASDGHVEYEVKGQDLASAAYVGTFTAIDGETTVVGYVDKKTAAATKVATDGIARLEGAMGLTADATAMAFAGTTKYVKDSTTVKAGIEALDTALTGLNGAAIKSITVNSVAATIADNAATVEIKAGDIEYKANTAATGEPSNAVSVSAAIAALEAKAAATLELVEQGNGISVSVKDNQKQTITAVAVNNDPIIEVTANGIGTKAEAVWDCGYYN